MKPEQKEKINCGIYSSISSPSCDALAEFDCQGLKFPSVENVNSDPYWQNYADAII